MFVAGHVGITLGAARVVAWGFDAARNRFDRSARIYRKDGAGARLRLRDALDDRVIAFGSLLPDILDKPIALILAGDLVGNSGRNVGHTLIFALALIAAAGAAAFAFRRGWAISLALASAGHLALDRMWNHAQTLFWPFAGLAFPSKERVSVSEWTESTMLAIPDRMGDPLELLGLAVICWIAARVLWSRGVKSYLLTGRIGRGGENGGGGGGGDRKHKREGAEMSENNRPPAPALAEHGLSRFSTSERREAACRRRT